MLLGCFLITELLLLLIKIKSCNFKNAYSSMYSYDEGKKRIPTKISIALIYTFIHLSIHIYTCFVYRSFHSIYMEQSPFLFAHYSPVLRSIYLSFYLSFNLSIYLAIYLPVLPSSNNQKRHYTEQNVIVTMI